MSQNLSNAVAVIGIDIGKNSFHVVGLDGDGAVVLRQKWSRGQVEVAGAPQVDLGIVSFHQFPESAGCNKNNLSAALKEGAPSLEREIKWLPLPSSFRTTPPIRGRRLIDPRRGHAPRDAGLHYRRVGAAQRLPGRLGTVPDYRRGCCLLMLCDVA